MYGKCTDLHKGSTSVIDSAIVFFKSLILLRVTAYDMHVRK